MKSNANKTADFSGLNCVFLDRDGVINQKPEEGLYVSTWSDFHVLPGVERAISELNRRQYRVIVISNQRGIALGKYSGGDVEALHTQLQKHFATHEARIDAFYYCPHDKGQCKCRKPGTELLQMAMKRFPEIAPTTSVLIGDSLSDIEAARNFGCRSILVEGDPDTRKEGFEKAVVLADAVAHSLRDAVGLVLGQGDQASSAAHAAHD